MDEDIVDRMFRLVDTKFKEQKDFAAAIGVDASHISRWRNRKSSSYVKRLEKISRVLEVTPQYLLSGDKSKEDATSHKNKSVSVNEDDLKAAFFEGGEDLSQEEMDELWEDAKDYIQYKLDQRRRKKK
uniref:helix-turn-helix domain-containing protein n=1 Tax=Dysosmobacter welbionis TaxID=2093857 RepID=UPI003FEEBC86